MKIAGGAYVPETSGAASFKIKVKSLRKNKFARDDCRVSFGKLPRAILMICDVLLFRPILIRHLASRGIPTYVWVLNEESEFTRALDAGAAGIMTDYPSKLKLFTMNL